MPIWKSDAERAAVTEHAEKVVATLNGAGIRTKLDMRDDLKPGFKFNDWEMRGVPVRVERVSEVVD